MSKPLFAQIGQISMVVPDVYEAAKAWNDKYGIGPWKFLHFDKNCMSDLIAYGKSVDDLPLDIALCNMFDIEIELLSPKSDVGALADFLKENGSGLHHIAVVTPHNTFAEAKQRAVENGIMNIHGGKDPLGQEFAYMDFRKELGCVIELNDRPDDFHPVEPTEWYPPRD